MTDEKPAETGIIKRSVVIAGHRTSVSLEEPFWRELQLLAASKDTSVAAFIGTVDAARQGKNLSSAIRIAVLEHLLAQVARKDIGLEHAVLE